MSEIKVNFGSLEAGQAGILKAHASLVASLDDLESNLQPMLQTWDGEAREAYFQCKQQWDAAAAQMATTLQQIGQAVGTAQANYQGAENAAKNTWA
ncbi:WXG100 family type VII secretion target [Nocardioides sp. AE5]|uniref:WXG100 family type VII secretion target n=1 Tax=Nocardioides sp. AE5 TaxID=2962573 RepID=UPI0028817A85|nr:WXG100 family type VII secretion target [Nocardioides sp. AE5]MDT0202158.1 WXG100 family type VII secretion target [Nocardioides sp. AE5]